MKKLLCLLSAIFVLWSFYLHQMERVDPLSKEESAQLITLITRTDTTNLHHAIHVFCQKINRTVMTHSQSEETPISSLQSASLSSESLDSLHNERLRPETIAFLLSKIKNKEKFQCKLILRLQEKFKRDTMHWFLVTETEKPFQITPDVEPINQKILLLISYGILDPAIITSLYKKLAYVRKKRISKIFTNFLGPILQNPSTSMQEVVIANKILNNLKPILNDLNFQGFSPFFHDIFIDIHNKTGQATELLWQSHVLVQIYDLLKKLAELER